jgi:hypothetical protein
MKEIYFGKKVYLRYKAVHLGMGYCWVTDDFDLQEPVSIFETEKDDHTPHEVGQTIYFPDLEKDIKILRLSKNSTGGYVYWMDYTVEVVEDKETELSLKKAEEKLAEMNAEAEKLEKKRKESYGTIIPYESPKEPWYKRWFL